jgi:hypothetical protein
MTKQKRLPAKKPICTTIDPPIISKSVLTMATCSQILRFAKAHGLCEWDVTRDISLSDAHIESPPVTHRAALKIEWRLHEF